MFKNYIAITWRQLRKNKIYTVINIAGLAIGTACCMLILLFVAHELSYERWNPNAGRIYRPYADINFGGSQFNMAVVGSVVGPDATQAIPEVQAFCRFRQNGSYLVKREGQGQPNFREEDVLRVDSSFFEIFPRPILQGDTRSCLTQPATLALSHRLADKYFGSPQMALGQILILENEQRYRVTAVFEDIPANTHFKADILLAMNGDDEVRNDSPLWATSNNFQTYFLLRKGADPKVFQTKFAALSTSRINETAQRLMGVQIADLEKSGQHARYLLQALPDIHLYSNLTVELQPNGNIQYVWIFAAIAAFILLIACINFMNLSTARSAQRAREVGVRKVLGSARGMLVSQFLSETLVLAAIAMALALAITALTLPAFGALINRPVAIPWSKPLFWCSLLAATGIVGLLAGIYPAFFLSSFDPVKAIKTQAGGRTGGGRLRSTLVVFQFTTAIILIIATGLVYKQLNYIQTKNLGFRKEQVLVLDNAYALGDKLQAYRQELLKQPAIRSVSASGYLPVPSYRSDNTFSKSRAFSGDQAVNMQYWTVDKDYLHTLGLELKAGRFFDPGVHPSDSAAVVLNERAAALFGIADQPIGKEVYGINGAVKGQPKPEDFYALTVIGVVKDFHFASLRNNIGALSMHLGDSRGMLAIRYDAAESQSVMSAMEDLWKRQAPDQPFKCWFLDEAFSRMYDSEQRIGRLASIFALLAILISCLGLFGLAAFTAEQRTKEIGIRKVLGANVVSIVGLLSKEFLRLVLIALILAAPVAWYFLNRWLENFAFHIAMPWWVFAAAGAVAVLIAILTVSLQSIKAAIANPIHSLRNE